MSNKPALSAALVALALTVCAAAASAQVISVTGSVAIKQPDGTARPVPDAVIDIYRVDIPQKFETRTDNRGRFVNAGIPFVGTYTLAASAPGARPSFVANVKLSRHPDGNDFVLEPGDGSRLTLDQIRAAVSGGAAPGGPAATASTEEARRRADEAAKERARIEAENVKAQELNARLTEILKSGNEALTAGRYGDAISFYDQGARLDPAQPIFYRNKGVALRARGVDRYNAALKANDEAGRDAARMDFAAGVESAEKAVASYRESASKRAAAAGQNNAPEELGYLFDRAEVYRVALQTSAPIDSEAADAAMREYAAAETDPAKRARMQAALGRALMVQGRYDESVSLYRQILRADPDNLDGLYGLGNVLAFKNDDGRKDPAAMSEAAGVLRKFIAKAPDTDPRRADAAATLRYLEETLKSAGQRKP